MIVDSRHQGFQCARGAGDHIGNRWHRSDHAVVGVGQQAQVSKPDIARVPEGNGNHTRVLPVDTSDDRQAEFEILDPTGHGPCLRI